MNLAQGLSLYLTLNLLLALAFLALSAFEAFAKNGSLSSLLRLHYQALVLALTLTAIAPMIPSQNAFEPVAKVWSGVPFRSFTESTAHARNPGIFSLGNTSAQGSAPASAVSQAALLLLSLCLALALIRLAKDFRALSRIRRSAFPLRRIGRVEILAHEGIAIPFSLRTRTAQVVMPANLLANPEAFRLALKHELQHHRQGDTLWAYALLALKAFCAPNPALYWWQKRLHEIQEFACDEAVLGQRKVNSQAYARCLLEVAEQAFHRERIPACATGFSFRVERDLTKRRIERMMHSKVRKWNTLPLCAALALMLGASAFAAKSLVQDRRVSLTQAKEMAAVAAKTSEFPVTVNERVLSELNRYLGTPEGREYIRASLERMETHRAMIEAKLAEYDMPAELLAVPIIESGYRNLEETGKHGYGAGLWMFIQSTARNYGLRVDDSVDERLNTELLTDAAMRYWRANYLRFRDWQLAGLAYNMGENGVQKAINETGSRNAWDLIRAGHEGDKNYLARLMAAILILKNPEVLR